MNRTITTAEENVIDALEVAGKCFDALPAGHQDDEDDFNHAVRTAQNVVYARASWENKEN